MLPSSSSSTFTRERLKGLWRPLIPIFVIISLLTMLLVELKRNHAWSGMLPSFREILEYLESLSTENGSCLKEYVLFGLIVFFSTICGVPITPVEVTAGYVLKWRALIVAFPAKTAGSTASFLMGRYFWYDLVRSTLEGSEYYKALQILTQNSEFKFLFLSRFMYVPIWVKNYGVSVTSVSFRGFLLASASVGFLFSVIFVYVGVTTSSIVGAMSAESEVANPVTLSLLVIGIICLTVGLAWIFFEIRRKIHQLQELEVDESAARLLSSSAAQEEQDYSLNSFSLLSEVAATRQGYCDKDFYELLEERRRLRKSTRPAAYLKRPLADDTLRQIVELRDVQQKINYLQGRAHALSSSDKEELEHLLKLREDIRKKKVTSKLMDEVGDLRADQARADRSDGSRSIKTNDVHPDASSMQRN
ncbi:hypothetical protein FOL47_009478 [Perkinsus chesapeaki]|uniref:VTT domain-containing protein n=1 Tax=Perkinsus chesapeaki TaxID=330153 RepID=A0A7J6L854_PERCH|nr:hypothetical protein FOL47_009478 [Perkinsus chesapeaki]